MSLKSNEELIGMQQVSQVVGLTLKRMQAYARPGMSTYELDQYGTNPAGTARCPISPQLTYNFPGLDLHQSERRSLSRYTLHQAVSQRRRSDQRRRVRRI